MRRRKPILPLVIFSALALAGCDQTANLKTVCPVLKNYSKAQLSALALEYGALPGDVQSLISDYRLLRKQCAAIAK
jgi:hypothetical protein